MESYPRNSNQSTRREKPTRRETEPKPEKKIERVVVNQVTRRKRPLGKRFTETFINGDAQSVAGYIANDVLLPAAKDTISDAVSQAVERMLFGESRGVGRSRSGRSSYSGYTSYNRMGPTTKREEPRHEMSRRGRAMHDFEEIVLETRAEADSVLDQLYDVVNNYDVVTVADLYDMVGQRSTHVDEKWGWTDLRGARAQRVRGGYLLDLPRPEWIE